MFKKFSEEHPYLDRILMTMLVSVFVILILPLFNIGINKDGIYIVLFLLLFDLWMVKRRRAKAHEE